MQHWSCLIDIRNRLNANSCVLPQDFSIHNYIEVELFKNYIKIYVILCSVILFTPYDIDKSALFQIGCILL